MAVSTEQGYRALKDRAAWIDLTGRGVLRATGEDRARLLHAMTSNHVQQLNPGQGCYAFFLNAQGRILADVNLLCLDDSFLLDVEPDSRQFVYDHLDKFIIADDVTLEDLSDETAIVNVEGPTSAAILAALNAPAPEEPGSHAPWGNARVARISYTGQPGWRIFAPRAAKSSLLASLEASGAVAAGPEAARMARIETGKPRFGEDFGDKQLPHETQLLHALHFNKGCYLGQEIVERVRSRGMVHRHLVPLLMETNRPPAQGAKILSGEEEAGEVTSAVFAPDLGAVAALGYLRTEYLSGNPTLTVDSTPIRVRAPKPATE
jgi:tRNA-modifying protein YgfZ